jgi:8-oxo-dGTP pyrophosphatase MutT (NUDIX family)
MSRQQLIKNIEAFNPFDLSEEHSKQEIIAFINSTPDCFDRVHHAGGHVTGSALLFSRDLKKVLLNHHKIFDCWMQFGGHADGESNIENVALREVIEESGISSLKRLGTGIVDIDIHLVAANDEKEEPEHKHYDVRYFFTVTDDSDFTVSDESIDLCWCSYEEACERVSGRGVLRMLEKWKERYARCK